MSKPPESKPFTFTETTATIGRSVLKTTTYRAAGTRTVSTDLELLKSAGLSSNELFQIGHRILSEAKAMRNLEGTSRGPFA